MATAKKPIKPKAPQKKETGTKKKPTGTKVTSRSAKPQSAAAKPKAKAKAAPAPAKKPSVKKTLVKTPSARARPAKVLPAKKKSPPAKPAKKIAAPVAVAIKKPAKKLVNTKKPAPAPQPVSKATPMPAPKVAPKPAAPAASKKPRFSKSDLEHFKTELLAMRERITGQSGSMRSAALQRNDEMNPEEDGTDAFMRLQTLEQVGTQQREVANIDEALRSIEQGAYGICEACGELISKPRLTVLPFATNCIKCQSEMEKMSRGRR